MEHQLPPRVGVSALDAMVAKVKLASNSPSPPASSAPASRPRSPRPSGPNRRRRRRVCIIGAGAAGMAAAWSLSRHPDKFEVEVWEATNVAGGVATSIALRISPSDGKAVAYAPTDPEAIPHMPGPDFIAKQRTPADANATTSAAEWTWLNDGVQGMSPQFHNTRAFFRALGFTPTPLHMRFSFNKGDDRHWNNTSDSPLLQEMRSNTRRFGILLYIMHYLAPFFTCIPISLLIKMSCFSRRFHAFIILPLVALFMGTGNRTSSVSATVVGQAFTNPFASLFKYDASRVVANQPEMAAFPCLHSVYQTARAQIEASGSGHVYVSRAVRRVFRYQDRVEVVDELGRGASFDDVIMACSPEVSLRILHEPSFIERAVLGNVAFYDDVTFTHQDEDYMRNQYDVDDAREDQYYIYSYEEEPDKIEMSFNLSNYQPQLKTIKQMKCKETKVTPSSSSSSSFRPLADVFQSIYLDHSLASRLWTMDRLRVDRIVAVKWWRQMAHRWQHFTFTVPFVHQLQSESRRTLYAGSWMLVNMHEVAVLSGLSAAYRLGADYSFEKEEQARRSFTAFLLFTHMTVPREYARSVQFACYTLAAIVCAWIIFMFL